MGILAHALLAAGRYPARQRAGLSAGDRHLQPAVFQDLLHHSTSLPMAAKRLGQLVLIRLQPRKDKSRRTFSAPNLKIRAMLGQAVQITEKPAKRQVFISDLRNLLEYFTYFCNFSLMSGGVASKRQLDPEYVRHDKMNKEWYMDEHKVGEVFAPTLETVLAKIDASGELGLSSDQDGTAVQGICL